MFNVQSNGARLIYTLLKEPPLNVDVKTLCRLTNGFYFVEASRSDEKLRYTKRDITEIIRTVLYMHVFDVAPLNSTLELVNGVELDLPEPQKCKVVTLLDVVALLDGLFGKNFSQIAKTPVSAIFKLYNCVWRYFNVGKIATAPVGDDFLKMIRFINVTSCKYSIPTLFVTRNSNDSCIYLQNTITID